jgi:hypothetical protein
MRSTSIHQNRYFHCHICGYFGSHPRRKASLTRQIGTSHGRYPTRVASAQVSGTSEGGGRGASCPASEEVVIPATPTCWCYHLGLWACRTSVVRSRGSWSLLRQSPGRGQPESIIWGCWIGVITLTGSSHCIVRTPGRPGQPANLDRLIEELMEPIPTSPAADGRPAPFLGRREGAQATLGRLSRLSA